MDSQDQVEKQSTDEQPEAGKGDEAVKQSQKWEVAGEQLTGNELYSKFKDLQGEYTKSRQELSDTKKTKTLTKEEQNALDFIKNNVDFVSKSDLDNISKSQKQESTLRDIISSNSDLQIYEDAIKEIVKNTGLAPEDVIEKYNFKSKDKLAKARGQGDIKGTPASKEKSIADMSMEEYEKYRTKKGIGTNKGTFSN